VALQGVEDKDEADAEAEAEAEMVDMDCWYSVVCQEAFDEVDVAGEDTSEAGTRVEDEALELRLDSFADRIPIPVARAVVMTSRHEMPIIIQKIRLRKPQILTSLFGRCAGVEIEVFVVDADARLERDNHPTIPGVNSFSSSCPFVLELSFSSEAATSGRAGSGLSGSASATCRHSLSG